MKTRWINHERWWFNHEESGFHREKWGFNHQTLGLRHPKESLNQFEVSTWLKYPTCWFYHGFTTYLGFDRVESMGHPGLCHENVLRLQLVFETWRRVRTKARARDLIGGLLNQDRAILIFCWGTWGRTLGRTLIIDDWDFSIFSGAVLNRDTGIGINGIIDYLFTSY
jgi:hypothetical protein